MTGESMQTACKILHATAYQLLSEKWKSHYTSFPAIITKQYKSRTVSANQSSQYGQFALWKEAITCNRQIDTFCCQPRMGYKTEALVSMHCGHLSGQSDSEQWKN